MKRKRQLIAKGTKVLEKVELVTEIPTVKEKSPYQILSRALQEKGESLEKAAAKLIFIEDPGIISDS